MLPSAPLPPPPPPPPPVRRQSLRQQYRTTPSSANGVIGADVDASIGDAILSSRGTVRGHRRRVRDSLQALERRAANDSANNDGAAGAAFLDLPANGVVLYITSLTVIRPTFEACQAVRRILHTHRVQFEERNLLFNRAWHSACSIRPPPLLFIDGSLIGGLFEVERLNESGELAILLARQPRLPVGKPAVGPSACAGCGGLRHVVCPACRGSRRQRVAATAATSPADFRLRCTACEATGVSACPVCSTGTTEPGLVSGFSNAASNSISAPASLRGGRRMSNAEGRAMIDTYY